MALTKPDHRMSKLLAPVSSDLSGGVIERGSNANGEYVKFADGTLICTNSHIACSYGAAWTSHTWTFPVAFTEAPTVVATPKIDNGGWDRSPGGWPSTTSYTFFRAANYNNDTVYAVFAATATGRWY